MARRKRESRISRKQFLIGSVGAAIGFLADRAFGAGALSESALGRLVGLGGKPAPIPSAQTESPERGGGTTGTTVAVAIANVLDYGADPTGIKDSSDAFARALKAIEEAAVANPAAAEAGNRTSRGRAKLIVPEGCFALTKPESLLRGSYRTKTLGLVIQGAGRGLTQIYYKNAKPDRYLLVNRDAWLFLTIADIEFVSSQSVNNFMYSFSEGGAQNYTFERCMWNGRWNYVFRLEGTNTNSEMTWYHCNMGGSVKAGVYVPADQGSDQFLNYNFFACQFEVEQGDYLVFEKGGNINVWGGSLIHYDKQKGGTFFKLTGGSHHGGVERFLCVGTRFEHRSAASKLIECEWNDGTVTFLSCDNSSQAFALPASVNATFRSIGNKMPAIAFRSCMLMGRHEFRYDAHSHDYPHQVVYDSCEFAHGTAAEPFVVYTPEEGAETAGGRPVVRFRDCRSLHGTAETGFFDSDRGFGDGRRATLAAKLVSVKNAEGALPAGGAAETFRLPLGAVVLSIRFHCSAEAAAGLGMADYWIETAESPPRRLAAVYETAEGGFEARRELGFECADEEKCTLRLRAGPGAAKPLRGGLCLVEYIG